MFNQNYNPYPFYNGYGNARQEVQSAVQQASQYYGQPQMQPQPQQPSVTNKFVTNINEAKSAVIDPASINLFISMSEGRIYMKTLNNNGQSDFHVFGTINEVIADPVEGLTSKVANLENVVAELQDKIKGVKNEPVQVDEQSNKSNKPTK